MSLVQWRPGSKKNGLMTTWFAPRFTQASKASEMLGDANSMWAGSMIVSDRRACHFTASSSSMRLLSGRLEPWSTNTMPKQVDSDLNLGSSSELSGQVIEFTPTCHLPSIAEVRQFAEN